LSEQIPFQLEIPEDVPTELPDPHYFEGAAYSWRLTNRAHHRLVLPSESARAFQWLRRRVQAPIVQRDFEPFVWSWTKGKGQTPTGRDYDGFELTAHYRPDRKVNHWMNKKMWDWKHAFREDQDHAAANALAHISYRSHLWPAMYGSLQTGNPRIVSDTALALSTLRRI
jgi:hypothetical protein